MPLAPGTRLGSYEILGLLGAGGMGEVYRARDARLDRDVAVKVLPQTVAEDSTALARFEREAKAVAALAHPNIVAIYDFGSASGVTYAAMELLEGETLRQRLAHGPLPPRKAAELARQVAGALGAAHGRGIVHRDLKPENIFVGHDGRAKVLDFGLAAAAGPAGDRGEDPTRTSLTTPGTVMGTVGYMAPEQVRGDPVDHRADIFSFGCVLHEALTGTRAFARDTSAETMTAILREDPPEPESLNPAVSPALARVVRRCLEKRPEERFQSAQDLAFAVDNSLSGAGPIPEIVGAARRRLGTPGTILAVAGAAALGLLAGFALARSMRPSVSSAEPVRLRTLTVSGADNAPTASPDGRIVAFASSRTGTSRIWIKQLAAGGEEPLTAGLDESPRFSPDGSALLFLRDEVGVASAYRQSLVGGQVRKLVEDATDACWSPDGTRIAFLRIRSDGGRRWAAVGVADAQGGDERILHEAPSAMFGVRWSPDGRELVAIECSVTGNSPDYRLLFVDVATGEAQRRKPGDGNPLSSPAWLGDGTLVLAESGSLLGDQGDPLARFVRYDPRSGSVRTLFFAENVFPLHGLRTGFTEIDVLRPGALVFQRTVARQTMREVSAPGRGAVDRRLTRTEGRDRQPVYSPDGRRVMFSSNRSGNLDLWVFDLGTGELRQLTDDAAQDWDPGFTPDGERIVWSSDRGGHLEIWIAEADGSAPRQVTRDGVDAENPTVTADGEWIVYWSANPDKLGVWKIRLDGSDATRLVEGAYLGPEVSPDGRHAAFVALEQSTLRTVIQVVDVERGNVLPFRIHVPTPMMAVDIIVGRLRWLRDGSGLAYVGVDERGRSGIYAQDFALGGDTSASRRPLAGFSPDYVTESFAISPDGRSLTLSTLEQTTQIMLAEGVPGVSRARP